MDVADVGLLVELIEEGVLSDNPKYHNQAFNCNNGGMYLGRNQLNSRCYSLEIFMAKNRKIF